MQGLLQALGLVVVGIIVLMVIWAIICYGIRILRGIFRI